ncbi:MAG: UrcA family protein [Proteobacteria bacterium]|nr:UrcA family protein [Pseudomonadota bacterium]
MKKFFLPLLLLVFSASAFANSDRFKYNPNDLSTPEALAGLHVQIEDFARRYCASRRSDRRFNTCAAGVELEIVEKINNSRLATYAANGTHTEVVAAI